MPSAAEGALTGRMSMLSLKKRPRAAADGHDQWTTVAVDYRLHSTRTIRRGRQFAAAATATTPAAADEPMPGRRPLATSAASPSSDCVSSTALMVFRGIGAGLAWTIGVDLYALVSASGASWQEHLATRPPGTTRLGESARLLVRAGGRNVLMFGGFLTVFGGLTCSLELIRGRHDAVNPFVGGFASGLVILPREFYRTPRLMGLGAGLCGLAAMGLYQFIPASSEGGDRRAEKR